MKNIVLIFAGGSGIRMNSISKPKQFLSLHGKEIIVHTIEQFDNHPLIDAIVVVCIEEWIDYLNKILHTFHIQKVCAVLPGGVTGQDSIYNGLQAIYNLGMTDSIVLIHDGVRPLITEELISKNIETARLKGSSITITPAIETIVNVNEEGEISHISDRSVCFHAKAPQTFIFQNIWQAHLNAKNDGILHMIDSASLMKYYKYPLYTVLGNIENIKITNPSDFYMFRALFEVKENSQIFGI